MSGPGILDSVQGWVAQLEELHLLEQARKDALARSLEEARKGRLDEPLPPTLTVLLLGASGVGKSELLNALAGERIAQTDYIRPTTTIPTLYVHESLAPSRLFEYGATLAQMAQSPANLSTHERPELRDKIIVDAPDIDSFQLEHRKQVFELLPAVDVVLYVVTAQTYKNDLGWQTVLAERGKRAFAFVFNKWDAEGKPFVPAGSPDVDEDFLRLLREKGGYEKPLLFRVSAKYWADKRSGQLPGEVPPPPGDQFPQLEAWLASGLSTSEVEQIQRRRRRAAWGSLAASVSAALPTSLAASPWRGELVSEMKALREDVWRNLRPLLSSRARQLARMRDTERRPSSPGPFGLGLRMISGIGSIGQRKLLAPPPGAEGEAPAAEPETSPFPMTLAQTLERRLTSLEWKARQEKLPIEWVREKWEPIEKDTQPQLEAALRDASLELMNKPFTLARRLGGYAVLTVAELTMLGILGLAVWRLGQGYLTGSYLGGVFAVNLLALLLCVFVVGYALVTLLFTSGEGPFRRELESRLSKLWREDVTRLEGVGLGFLERTETLRKDGKAILSRCDTEIRALSATLQTTPAEQKGPGGESVRQLFGKP